MVIDRKRLSDSDLAESCMRVKFGLPRPCKYSAAFVHSSSYSKSSRVIEKLSEKMATVNKNAHPFDKVRLEALLNRRFFYAPAFEIYGGTHILPFSSKDCLIKALQHRCRWSL